MKPSFLLCNFLLVASYRCSKVVGFWSVLDFGFFNLKHLTVLAYYKNFLTCSKVKRILTVNIRLSTT